MAKRVIQLYDKYKSTTKVYPLIVGACITPDAKDKIDEIIEDNIVANPELAGTEGSLTSLKVGDTKYKVEQPINVVANPTLAGTEADLESIEIGETKYKIGGGGKQLYKHNIYLRKTNVYHITVSVINDSATPFDISSFLSYLYTNFNAANGTELLHCSGFAYYGSTVYNIMGLAKVDSTALQCKHLIYNMTNSLVFENLDLQGTTGNPVNLDDTVETL